MLNIKSHIQYDNPQSLMIIFTGMLLLTFSLVMMPISKQAFADEVTDAKTTYEEAQQRLEKARQENDNLLTKQNETKENIRMLEKDNTSIIREIYKARGNITLDYLIALLTNNTTGMEAQTRYNTELTNQLTTITQELENKQQELNTLKDQSDKALTEANEAIEQAKKALETAEKNAEEAKKLAEERNATYNNNTSTTNPENPSLPPVDWSLPKEQFINEWGTRIDKNLEGRTLHGYGKVFAEAAYECGIHPAFSPAISIIESSGGDICFRPHNAWGWGNTGWDSWEEAIKEHVQGLATGYGEIPTLERAQKYCPPNYQYWYESVVKQMQQT